VSAIAATAAAAASGLAWLSYELVGRIWSDDSSESYCDSAADHIGDTAFAMATTMTAIALLSFFNLLRGRARWLALAGAAGVAASGYGNAVEHCVAEPFFVFFVGGLMVYLLITSLLGVVLLRTGELSRWIGLFFVVSALGLMLGLERGGAAVVGAGWLGVAVSMGSLALARRTMI
jgi:hypothetical protein